MPKKTKKTKEETLFTNLLKVVRQFMQGRSFLPLSLSDIMEKLSIPIQHRDILVKILDHLVHSEELILSKNRYEWKKDPLDVISGTIRMHPRGFGFVEPDNQETEQEDVFIPKNFTQNAVDGDHVEIIINHESISEKGPEGKVVGILKRGRTHIAGIIKEKNKHDEYIAYVPMLGQTQKVVVDPGEKGKLEIGDRVIMEVIDWGSKDSETYTRFSHHLGHINDHRCDILAAIEEYELRKDFPRAVIEEAKAFGKVVRAKDIADREDLRESLCYTIDPDTAKDFDDALSLNKDKRGNYHLGVHIADVTHYVPPNSALDTEARLRANSTYFPGFCLPMLPHELSSNLCSLKPNTNRLAVSILMVIDKEGNLKNYRITRSVIKSKKRFSYKEAFQVLEGKKKSPFKENLELMVELCHLLKQKRFERGSLDLALPDLIVIVNEEGFPERTEYVEYDITHQLVEEFMLKANEVIATHLTEENRNLTYRVHETPPDDNMKDFVNLARAFGFELPDKPTQDDLQKLFDKSLETPYGQHLATSYIRKMRMAIYSPNNIGHYGLSLTHYCHFTSPIRRYADLVVHRILLGGEDNPSELEKISAHCSEQERISARAETSVVILKKLRLIDGIYKLEPTQEYEAVITGVKPWGITLEILAFMMETFIHISEIGNDYFVFEERKMRLVGRHTNKIFATGDNVRVILKNINFITLESKWNIILDEEPKRRKQKKKSESEPEKDKEFHPKKKKKKKK